MPMRRPGAGPECRQIHAKILHPDAIAEPTLGAAIEMSLEMLRIDHGLAGGNLFQIHRGVGRALVHTVSPRLALPTTTENPSARHSGKPSVSRLALNPRTRSAAT